MSKGLFGELVRARRMQLELEHLDRVMRRHHADERHNPSKR